MTAEGGSLALASRKPETRDWIDSQEEDVSRELREKRVVPSPSWRDIWFSLSSRVAVVTCRQATNAHVGGACSKKIHCIQTRRILRVCCLFFVQHFTIICGRSTADRVQPYVYASPAGATVGPISRSHNVTSILPRGFNVISFLLAAPCHLGRNIAAHTTCSGCKFASAEAFIRGSYP